MKMTTRKLRAMHPALAMLLVGLSAAQPLQAAEEPPALPRDVSVQGRMLVKDGRLFVPRGVYMRGATLGDPAAFQGMWGVTPAQWLEALAESGANTVRILPTLMENGREVVARPESDPNHADQVARYLESLLRAAKPHGMQIVIVPTGISWDTQAPYHGNQGRWTGHSFGEFTDWDNHPYNQRNGGPLGAPSDILDSEAGRALFAKRIDFYLQFARHANLIGLDLESREHDGHSGWQERNNRISFLAAEGQRIRQTGLKYGLKMDALRHEHTRGLTPPGTSDWQRYKHGDGWWWPTLLGVGQPIDGVSPAVYYVPEPAWTSRPHLDLLISVVEARNPPRQDDRTFRFHRALAALLAYTPEVSPSQPGSVAEQFRSLCRELTLIRPIARRMEAARWSGALNTSVVRGSHGIQSGDGRRQVAFIESPAHGYARLQDQNAMSQVTGFVASPDTSGIALLHVAGGMAYDVLAIDAATGEVILDTVVEVGDIPILSLPEKPLILFVQQKKAGE